MEKIPKVSVIIVNYNSGNLLARCVSALAAQTMPDFEAIIVDNASCDDSLKRASIDDNRFRVLRLPSNVGFAAGNNRGADIARAPWIATLNPDAFPEPNWLDAFIRALERYPNIYMMGSTQISMDNADLLDGVGDCYHALGFPWRGGYRHKHSSAIIEGEVFGPCAAAAFYHAETFKILGGFDESFFCYCEDVDLAFRFRLFGHRCVQLADAKVYHYGAAITGESSPFTLWHSARNRLWVIIKNMPLLLLVFLLPAHILVTCYLLYRHRHSHNNHAQWEGFKAGILGLRRVIENRRRIQRFRRASSYRIARSFSWSLRKLIRHEPDIRPYS